jgi:SNF2 family DNA or RNA helicase
MPTLKIDYDAMSIEAVLETDQPGKHWEIVLRTVRDFSSEIAASAELALRVPWWIFLSARRALAYQIGLNDIPVIFSAAVRELLLGVGKRDDLLARAASIPELADAAILDSIRMAGFVRRLKPFQKRNLRKLCRLPIGATFSVPGSGKTTEALAFFSYHRKNESRLLVVAPKNAFAAWEEQSSICLGERETFIRLTNGRVAIESKLALRKPALMLITYEQLPTVSMQVAQYLSRYSSFIFLDESHRIKGGAERVRANAVLEIASAAEFKLILSGTPLPNAVTDLVPQLKFIAPELSVNDEDVSEQIKPFFVRTTKSDLDLPEPKRILIPIPMREEQRKLYELLCSEIARDAERDIGRDARRAFRAIGRSAVRLLQYVSNPSLLAGKIPEFDDYLGQVIEEGDSPKMEWVCGRAHQLARQRKKVIIWSSFVENVEVLAERLEDLGANFIHGGVEASSDAEADSREARVLRFHEDPYAMVLVANPAACGEGISLHTVCDHAIYLDRNYNAAQYLQSEDRIHRIGSDHQKFVEIVVCPDSVDLSVDRRLRTKITRMAETLNDRNLHVSPISIDPDEINLDDDDVLDLLAHLRTAEEAAA